MKTSDMINLFSPHKRWAIVDLETTGLHFLSDRITEIGVLIVNENGIERVFHSLINPQCPVPALITTITGIKDSDLKDAPTFEQVSEELYELLQDCLFIAHNAKFDYSFLAQAFAKCGKQLNLHTLCTVQLSRNLFPENPKHSLESWIPRLGVNPAQRHRAVEDARVVYDLLQYVHKQVPSDKVNEIWQVLRKKSRIPPLLKPSLLDDLPESPGVYIFEDEQGAPLYIGKSINIRSRVLNHFYNSHSNPKELHIFQQTARVNYYKTATELGALLLESNLVKEKYPTYNRLLRRLKQFTTVREIRNADNYACLTIDSLTPEAITSTENILGLYRSKKQAESHIRLLSKHNRLCLKTLGVEKATYSCFGYHIGLCGGTCVGSESAEDHNQRVAAAFQESKVTPWPWPKETIVILESQDQNSGEKEYFLIRDWCVVGYGKIVDNLVQFSELPMHFDYDQYKIINQAINRGTVLLWSEEDFPYPKEILLGEEKLPLAG
ncbi:3'-5' exoribonuclease [Candidatus Gracilibacteria bacterium]|nr:3'-5' exoribonuclease [Candidatus Gracilibacteria bacterium]